MFLAHVLEGRRKRREADEEARLETWRECRTKIMEVKNLAASLYERRTSDQYDHMRKPFLRDLGALDDLAGYWHSHDLLLLTVPRYLSCLQTLYAKNELLEDEREIIKKVYWQINMACTDIIDKGHLLLDPRKRARILSRQVRKWVKQKKRERSKEAGVEDTAGADKEVGDK